MSTTSDPGNPRSHALLDVLIRTGLIAILAISCYWVFQPFLDLMLWSMILAVTLYPLHRMLKRKLSGKDGLTATVIVVISIAVLLIPIYLLSASIATSVESALAVARGGQFHVPPPADSVASWPLVGGKVHSLWLQASTDLSGLMAQYGPQLKAFSLTMVGKLAGFGMGILLFMVALILAGIFMAYGEAGTRSAVQIASRIVGQKKGPEIAVLCTSTIRAVAQGVIGIAFIQMALVGAGFVLLDVPGAGLLAIGVLLLGIAQVPATIITIPVIIYVFATGDASVKNIILAGYIFLAGLVDNVLKPLMLGRGVDVPMPVVLIGALGGMVTKGVIGLFLGPVVLGVGYMLFWQWVRETQQDVPPEEVIASS